MLLREIADRINVHLKRFEADPKINRYKDDLRMGDLRPYYGAHATTGGRFVRVCYISYQGKSSLTKADAEKYLAWLDAGNVGAHYKQQREAK